MGNLPTKFGVVRVSPHRYQAAKSHTRSGRGDIMLEDWDTFGPRFADWRQAHDHAVSVMTQEQLANHVRDDMTSDELEQLRAKRGGG